MPSSEAGNHSAVPSASPDGAPAICRDLLRLPSVSLVDGEAAVAEYVVQRLTQAGLEPRVVAARPDRPNVLCAVPGGSGPRLLLTGHMDTVPATAEEWEHDPFSATELDGRIYGRGASDMKGGLAAMLAVVLAVARARRPLAGELVLAATADEDGDGWWGLPWLLAEGHIDADAAIVGEPSGVDRDFDGLYLATRGYAFMNVEVIADAGGHSSLYDRDRPHAVAIAAQLQQALEAEFPTTLPRSPTGDVEATVVAGERLAGGGDLGVLPRRATLGVDCRLLPGMASGELLRRLRAFVAQRVPSHARSTTVGFDETLRQPWAEGMALPSDSALAEAARRVLEEVGVGDLGGRVWPGFSEAAHLTRAGIATLPAIGPGTVREAHAIDESVSVRAVLDAASIIERLVSLLLAPRSALGHG